MTTMATAGGTTTTITVIITMAGWLSSFDAKGLWRAKGGLGRPFAFSVARSQEPQPSKKKIKEASNLFRCRDDR